MTMYDFMALWRAWLPPVVIGWMTVVPVCLILPPSPLTLRSALRRTLIATVMLTFSLSLVLVLALEVGLGFAPTVLAPASVLLVIGIGDVVIARWWSSRRQLYTIGILWAQSAIAGAIFTQAAVPDQWGHRLVLSALLGVGMAVLVDSAYPRSHAAPRA
jgi:hypothetical protein